MRPKRRVIERAALFDYTADGRLGWIEVVGARTEGNQYQLWGSIREGVPPPGRS